MQAYKLSIVIFTDDADPADLLQAIQDAGESIAADYDGDCPEMDGANAMVQCLDETPTSNHVRLGTTMVDDYVRVNGNVRQQRDALLVALKRLVVLRLTHAGTAAQVHQSWEEAVSAIKKVEGPAASWVDRPEYALKNTEGGA